MFIRASFRKSAFKFHCRLRDPGDTNYIAKISASRDQRPCIEPKIGAILIHIHPYRLLNGVMLSNVPDSPNRFPFVINASMSLSWSFMPNMQSRVRLF